MRREQEARQLEKRAQREIDAATSDQTRGDYEPPARRDCRERNFYLPVDDPDTIRIDVRLWHYPGTGLVDFYLSIEILLWDTWTQLAEIDCCHGHVHMHQVHGGEKQKASQSWHAINSAEDVADGYLIAAQMANSGAIRLRDNGGRNEREEHG